MFRVYLIILPNQALSAASTITRISIVASVLEADDKELALGGDCSVVSTRFEEPRSSLLSNLSLWDFAKYWLLVSEPGFRGGLANIFL